METGFDLIGYSTTDYTRVRIDKKKTLHEDVNF